MEKYWCICNDDCEICFHAKNESEARTRAERACGKPCYCVELEEEGGG